MVVFALAAPDAAEIEPHRGKPLADEHLVQLESGAMIHRAAKQWMGVKDKRYGRVFSFSFLIAAFKTPVRSGENDFWHSVSVSIFQAGRVIPSIILIFFRPSPNSRP
jgi:hypothetical protein